MKGFEATYHYQNKTQPQKQMHEDLHPVAKQEKGKKKKKGF